MDANKFPYKVFNHALAETAQEVAASQYRSGREMAKVVTLDVGGIPAMAIIPATRKISPAQVARSLNVRTAWLAAEQDFISR